MSKIQSEKRFKETISIIKHHIPFKNFVEIGGTDASFKNFVPHDTWKILDKYGEPDIKVDLDSRTVKLPYEEGSIECIILTEVLEHLRIGTPLIKEITRCLQPGGVLLISVPNAVSASNRFKWLGGKIPFMAASSDCGHPLGGTGYFIDGVWQGGHVVDFNKQRLKDYIERTGLKLVKFYRVSFNLKRRTLLPAYIVPVTLGNFLIATFSKQ